MKVEQALEKGRKPPRKQPLWCRTLRSSLIQAPLLSAGYCYAMVIHPLFQSCSTWWQRNLVYLFSVVVVKTGADKITKLTIQRRTSVPYKFADWVFYANEITLALVSRVLLLSLPNSAEVAATAVVTALWELLVRAGSIYLHNKRRKAIAKLGQAVMKKERRHYRLSLVTSPGQAIEVPAEEAEKHKGLLKRLTKKSEELQRRSVLLAANIGADMIVSELSPPPSLWHSVPPMSCDY